MEKISFRPEDFLPAERILYSEPMKDHTTFRIGGPAKVFLMPGTEEELTGIVRALGASGEKYTVIGNGSNLLVPDNGYDGVVIRLAEKNPSPEFTEEAGEYFAYFNAGARLTTIAKLLCDKGLAGFEFASGIPGTLGGAIIMNAGAYGGEIKDVTESVRVLSADGTVREYKTDECSFGYRTSRFANDGSVVLGAVLKFRKGDPAHIKAVTDELLQRRKDKQPLEYPSAGSTFKRPEGYFAGKLIQDAGLKGYRVGDACVSEKHSGFVINLGNATCDDVLSLIYDVQKKVFDTFGVMLEQEVKVLL